MQWQKRRKVVVNPVLPARAYPMSWPRGTLKEALDPARAPSKGRTFADMNEEERAQMRALYEK